MKREFKSACAQYINKGFCKLYVQVFLSKRNKYSDLSYIGGQNCRTGIELYSVRLHLAFQTIRFYFIP